MTVEDLIDLLRDMPQTALVEIEVDEEFCSPLSLNYDRGIVLVQTDYEGYCAPTTFSDEED